jgi:hypothetical protein
MMLAACGTALLVAGKPLFGVSLCCLHAAWARCCSWVASMHTAGHTLLQLPTISALSPRKPRKPGRGCTYTYHGLAWLAGLQRTACHPAAGRV